MKNLSILFLLAVLGFGVSCDYSSYRKNKDSKKEKSERMVQETTEGNNENSMEPSK